MRTVDVVIIGAGTAGLSAYRSVIKEGKTAVLIEGGLGGTTCARVGCMPSKLLIAAAEAAHAVNHAHDFGVHASIQHIDGFEVMDRVRRERDRFVGFVIEGVDAIASTDKSVGWASFTSSHTLYVKGPDTDEHIQFTSAVIATGSTPDYPSVWKTLGDRLIVNDDVFEWKTLPQSVAVFGPGVIGLELGQALHRLGVCVRIFGRSGRVGPLTDPDLIALASTIFKDELDIELRTQAHVLGVNTDGLVEIKFLHTDGTWHTEQFDYVLAATGRTPNLNGLNVEALGVSSSSSFMDCVDPQTLSLRSAPHIFVAGDANDQRPLLHEAADDGVFAGTSAARYPKVRTYERRAALSIVFTDPQIAVVGQSWSELEHDRVVTGRVGFHNQGRSRVMLKNKGALHVYVNKETGVLLGAELIGPSAEHLAHLLAWSVQQRLTIDTMLSTSPSLPVLHTVRLVGL